MSLSTEHHIGASTDDEEPSADISERPHPWIEHLRGHRRAPGAAEAGRTPSAVPSDVSESDVQLQAEIESP